jgi:hypothetical protein
MEKLTKKENEAIKNFNDWVYGGMYNFREYKKQKNNSVVCFEIDGENYIFTDNEPDDSKNIFIDKFYDDLTNKWIVNLKIYGRQNSVKQKITKFRINLK